MAQRSYDSYTDSTDRAVNSLDVVLDRERRAAQEAQSTPLEEAMGGPPVLEYDTGRSKTRVLFVTADSAFIDPTTDALSTFYDFARQFDEMHIIVLRPGIKPKYPTLRVRENIWVYIAHAEFWWWTPVIANEVVAADQLVFAAGFRADVVVALEPFEAGLAAQWIGQAYERPVQIHVRHNYFSRRFRRQQEHRLWRRLIAWYVLRKARYVAAATEAIKTALTEHFSFAAPPAVLPRFHHFAELTEAPVTTDLHEKYPMYDTIMLYVSRLDHECAFLDLLEGIKYKLANPRVGLVVVGDGRAKEEFERKVKKLGLATQVAFITDTHDIGSMMKTADLLLVPDTMGESNERVLQGAVLGVPMIMSVTELREDLFEEGESAFLYEAGETKQLIKKMNLFMREQERYTKAFKSAMQPIVEEKLHEDPVTYRRTYRDVIESVFETYYGDDKQQPAQSTEGQ